MSLIHEVRQSTGTNLHTVVDSGIINIGQNVLVSTSNNSTSNIAANGTWIGIGESTLNCAGIQVCFYSDLDCAVYVYQSSDNVHWDIKDHWEVTQEIGQQKSLHGRTVQAVGEYFRVEVVNLQAQATKILRLSCVLCPIVEALPRSLTAEGNLKVSIEEFAPHSHRIGGDTCLNTRDERQLDLLETMAIELRKMNYYLSSLCDFELNDEDLPPETNGFN